MTNQRPYAGNVTNRLVVKHNVIVTEISFKTIALQSTSIINVISRQKNPWILTKIHLMSNQNHVYIV